MRVPVRIAGLLLLAIGSLLWLRARLVVPVPHPVAIAAMPPVKPVTKRHRHTETVQSKLPSLQPSPTPRSRDFMSDGSGRHYSFEVDLHKSDGWFDTGIPVTADVDILMFCGLKLQALEPSCEHWVQAMAGGKVFAAGRPPVGQGSDFFTFSPNEPPPTMREQNLDPALLLQISDDVTETLKLKISDSAAPEELDGYIVRIYVRVQSGSQNGHYTAPQQMELTNLAKWVSR